VPFWATAPLAGRDLGHGRRTAQIETTNQLISERNTAFKHIPHDLPRIGLIVTMEDFPTADVGEIHAKLNVAPSIPTCVCSSEDLELLVTITDQGVDTFVVNDVREPSAVALAVQTVEWRLVTAHAILAILFGPVERRVGSFQKILRTVAGCQLGDPH
jgi:hypothetical protein